jgi:dihydroorotase
MADTEPRDLLVAGGRVVDPSQRLDARVDVRVRDGRIAEIGEHLAPAGDERRIDAAGLVVAPGLVDVHVHFREPGQEHKETILTGARSAAAGGFTSVCCMPNTSPVNDSAAITRLILARAAEAGLVNVFPIGAITKGSAGEELAPIGGLARAGCVAVSDDGQPVMNAQLMRRAMEYAAEAGLPVVDHCEDRNLAAGGVVNEGCCSARLGLRGINRVAEEVHVARDCLLAEVTGAHVHIAHISTARSLDFVRDAKARGLRVTCEVTPHHFALTEEAVGEFETNAKMNPPLRTDRDRDALLAGLADGTIDCIATDHAPHHADEKAMEFDRAPFGIVGLETSLSLGLTHLVETGRVDLARLVDLMSTTPARLFGLGRGTLAPGAPADVVCFDPSGVAAVDPATFRSLGRNTPFAGHRLAGRVVATVLGGRITFDAIETIGATAP